MEYVFIDTDVILDFLTGRKPFGYETAKVFSLIENKKLKGYVSSVSFSNLYYILRKFDTHKKVINSLSELSEIIDILTVDNTTIKSALRSGFTDFEDAIQYFTAKENKKLDCIITRNIKDYKGVDIAVMTPETFLATFTNISQE